VVILHDLTLALRHATHALLMSEDGLALHGPAEDVLTPAQCSRALRTPIIRISDGTHAALIPDGKRHE
ncbi:MAG: ABC transporter ATP-binding protein, partial [Cupriavidus sp.]|nr:ABC transporter ATP-binding protein [Cupriavidus sp.]